MYSGNESDAESMYMGTLEDIHDGIQSRPGVNRREACYKIRDHVKWSQA